MITYRRPGPGEWDLVQDMLSDLARADGGADARRDAGLIRDLACQPAPWFHALFAVVGGQPQGLAVFFPEYSSYRARTGAYVADLYVSPQARGMGLGRGLLAAVARQARDWGGSFVSLNVHQENPAAQGFYARTGFVLREDTRYLILEGAGLEALA